VLGIVAIYSYLESLECVGCSKRRQIQKGKWIC
jgi:hypothetical protein